jgi:hypothetical protein
MNNLRDLLVNDKLELSKLFELIKEFKEDNEGDNENHLIDINRFIFGNSLNIVVSDNKDKLSNKNKLFDIVITDYNEEEDFIILSGHDDIRGGFLSLNYKLESNGSTELLTCNLTKFHNTPSYMEGITSVQDVIDMKEKEYGRFNPAYWEFQSINLM